MKKFIYTPLWNIEQTEKILAEMEANGYRLDRVKYNHWYYFKETKPKYINYFLSYKTYIGEDMGTYDYSLVSQYHAQEINETFSSYTIYRTSVKREKLNFIIGARMDYIKSVILRNIFINLIILAPLLFVFILSDILYQKVLFGILSFVMILSTLYMIYGYVKQKKKIKIFEKTIKERFDNQDWQGQLNVTHIG